MRYDAFWLAVIALALAAIGAGYLSGASTARLPLRAAAHAPVQPVVHAVMRDPSDSAIDDLFSDDDVVLERPALAGSNGWAQPTLSVVVGLCGYSADEDERFMQMPLPVAFDVDPSAPQAARVAELAREAHDLVLVHVGDAPTPAQMTRLRRELGDFDGFASRSSERFVQALDGTGLLFFDERGNADAQEFRAVDIPFAQRDVTADDRTGSGYIRFMLDRAVQRSESEGRLVVLMRPRSHSLDALERLAGARTVQFVALTQGA